MAGDTELTKRFRAYASLDGAQVASELGSSLGGLTAHEAQHRRERMGTAPGFGLTSISGCVLRACVNPFSIVLIVIASVTLLADALLPAEYGRTAESVAIMVGMIAVSSAVRLVQELKTRSDLVHLTGILDAAVEVCRDGSWGEVAAAEVVVGDLVRLEAGDRVPADVRIVAETGLFVSNSALTGESTMRCKTADAVASPASDVLALSNIVFAGSTVVGGRAEGLVIGAGEATYAGSALPASDVRRRGFDRGAASIARVLVRFMLLLVPLVFVACAITKGRLADALPFSLSVAVGLTPELLPMVVSACLARGGSRMRLKRVVVKDVNAMQGFGSMDVLCMDKTGTLTDDTVHLEYFMDAVGNESARVLDVAWMGSRASTGVSNHVDRAILAAQKMPGAEGRFVSLAERASRVAERPFDHNRRFSSVLLAPGADANQPESALLVVKGEVEEVVARCSHVVIAGAAEPVPQDACAEARAIVGDMLEDGMKVLAVATRSIAWGADTASEADGVWLDGLVGDPSNLVLEGFLAFFDAPKADAAASVGRLQELNVHPKVLTGDDCAVAASVCRRLGIPADRVLGGSELDAMDENDVPLAVERTAVFAELTPRQKARVVKVLQDNGHTVGFLGDGMNDLPAIMRADVGISAGGAVDAVRDAANVILLEKDLNVLEDGVLEGRRAFANMNKYIRTTASSNFGNICSIVIASILLPFLPMTSVQLLLLNLLYDLLCLVLPWDHVDDERLERPLVWSGASLPRFMLTFGPVSSLFDIATFAVLFFFVCPALCGAPFQGLDPAGQVRFAMIFQTGWFLESLWTQVAIIHLLRTDLVPFAQSRPARPVIAVTACGLGVLTCFALTAPGAAVGFVPLPVVYLAFLAAVVAFYLMVVSLVKAGYRARYGSLG